MNRERVRGLMVIQYVWILHVVVQEYRHNEKEFCLRASVY